MGASFAPSGIRTRNPRLHKLVGSSDRARERVCRFPVLSEDRFRSNGEVSVVVSLDHIMPEAGFGHIEIRGKRGLDLPILGAVADIQSFRLNIETSALKSHVKHSFHRLPPVVATSLNRFRKDQ